MKNKINLRKCLIAIMVMLLTVTAGTNNHLMAMAEEAVTGTDYIASYEDADVKISVSAQEGVLPADAQLSVTPVKTQQVTDAMSEEEKASINKINEEYQSTSEKIKEGNEDVEGFLAYDISFLVNGEEVEPNGNVDVNMEFVNAIKPEGVSEDAIAKVQHLKEEESGIVVETLTENSSITTDDNAAVEKVNLSSNSFSVFVIAWTREKDDNRAEGPQDLLIKVMDTDGNEIENGNSIAKKIEITADEMKAKDLADIVIDSAEGKLDDYKFQKGYIIKNDDTKFDFNTIVRWNRKNNGTDAGGFQANKNQLIDYNDWAVEQDGNKYVYLVFQQKKHFTPVETIDSTSMGITMKMIDYYPTGNQDKQFTGADWTPAAGKNPKQGILSSQLKDGYPTFAQNNYGMKDKDGSSLIGKSLGLYYDESQLLQNIGDIVNANNLFIKKDYNQKGHFFYYDSSLYGAQFNENTGSFSVFEELTNTGNGVEIDYNYRGNFLPYNTYEDSKDSGFKNTKRLDGTNLTETDPKYNHVLYKPDQSAKYTFGMELSANFIQDKNGYYDGYPMRYEFSGDDDLWVYIDNVLILDIGGGHGALDGYIDFSTGEVYVQNASESYTTIRELFNKANIETSDSDWKKVQYKNYKGQLTDGWIFKDYTAHSMKMWYMERGGGASNLKIKFNLPVIPADQIRITKELGNEEDDIKYGNVQYEYKLYNTDNGKMDLVKTGGKLQKSNGTIEDLNISSDGIFSLKPGETAIFNDIAAYKVEEINIDQNIYDKVTINDIDTYITNGIATSDSYAANETPYVVFRNYPKKEKLSNLSITKTMKEGQTTEDKFNVKVTLDDNLYKGNYEVKSGEITESKSTNNGILELKVGETVAIKNILTDTKFEVTEELGNDSDYGKPIYSLNNVNNAVVETNKVTGTTSGNIEVKIGIENRYARTGELTLVKVDKENPNINLEGAEFTIYESDKDGDKELLKAISEKNGLVKFDISKLSKDKKYKIKETSPANGYLSGIMVNGKPVDYLNLMINETEDNTDGTITVTGTLTTPENNPVNKNNVGFTIQNLKDTRINIEVEKVWNDKDYVNRPNEVVIQLYQKVGNGEETKVDGKILTLTSEKKWKGSFTDLPYWDAKTKTKITYSIKEELKMNEYKSEIKSTIKKDKEYKIPSFTVTNTLLTGDLIINKKIVNPDEINPAHGDPIFTFKIERTDGSLVYYRTIRLNRENSSGSVTIKGLPLGEYIITELGTLRYICTSGVTQKATIKEEKTAEVNFENKLTKKDSFSHTDVVENQFTIGKDNKVSITQKKLTKEVR